MPAKKRLGALASEEMQAAKFENAARRNRTAAALVRWKEWPLAAHAGAGCTKEFQMEVILKEDVVNLGHRGDVVKVADGYGRNFLLPRKLALQATLANKAVIEQMRTAAARRSATEKVQAEALVAKLEPIVLSFTRKSGEAGHLFGSVTSADIAADLAAKGLEVDRRKIQLDEPLKSLGDFSVAIKLHREVTAHVKVKVLADATEEVSAEAAAAPGTEPAAVAEPAAEAAPAAEVTAAE
jgi:large subunit ribosomal protein L9